MLVFLSGTARAWFVPPDLGLTSRNRLLHGRHRFPAFVFLRLATRIESRMREMHFLRLAILTLKLFNILLCSHLDMGKEIHHIVPDAGQHAGEKQK
jgi:hypothetical protein